MLCASTVATADGACSPTSAPGLGLAPGIGHVGAAVAYQPPRAPPCRTVRWHRPVLCAWRRVACGGTTPRRGARWSRGQGQRLCALCDPLPTAQCGQHTPRHALTGSACLRGGRRQGRGPGPSPHTVRAPQHRRAEASARPRSPHISLRMEGYVWMPVCEASRGIVKLLRRRCA